MVHYTLLESIQRCDFYDMSISVELFDENDTTESWNDCENRYETLHLTDSGDTNITEDAGNTSNTNYEFCFDQKKRMKKRKERTPRKKYSETATHPKFDKNIF